MSIYKVVVKFNRETMRQKAEFNPDWTDALYHYEKSIWLRLLFLLNGKLLIRWKFADANIEICDDCGGEIPPHGHHENI